MRNRVAVRPSLVARLGALAYSLRAAWRRMVTRTFYAALMGKVGRNVTIYSPGMILHPEHMHIGNDVLIRYGCRFEVIDHGQDWIPRLTIGNNVNIEQNVHIICHDSVFIGNDVSITGHCAIVDVTHPAIGDFGDNKIGSQIDGRRSSVTIGDGSFIGFGSVILPNVSIGRGCIVGANSVVNCNIPDFSVAAGNPAKVIRTLYN